MKAAAAAIAVAAIAYAFAFSACTKRLEDTVQKEQLDPLRLLPQDSPFFVRVSPGGYKSLRPILAPVLDRQDSRPSQRKTVAAVDAFFMSDLSSKGLDGARPIFLAGLSGDTARLERVVSVGGIVEAAEVPKGLRAAWLFPAKDPGQLSQALEVEWTQHAAQQLPMAQHRISQHGEWVRLDVFFVESDLALAEATAAFDAELARAPAPLRLTPAVASFLTDPADLALYVQFDRVRTSGTAASAMRMMSVRGQLHEDDWTLIAATGSAELAAGWMLTDPSNAELEDMALRLRAEGGQSLTVESLATLTALGRKLAAGNPPPASGPKFSEAPYFLDVRAGGLGVAHRNDIPAPRIAGLLEDPPGDADRDGRASINALARLNEEGGEWTAMAMLRAPSSWLAWLLRTRTGGPKIPTGTEAIHLRVLPIDRGDDDDQNRLPRAAMVVQLPDAAAADPFMLDARKLAGPFGGLVTLEKLPSAEGGKAFVFVGFNVSPSVMMAPGGTEPWTTALAATIQKEAFVLVPAERVPDAWSLLLSQGPVELTSSIEGTVGRAQLRLGAPRSGPAPEHAAIPEFEARAYGGGTDACRFEVASLHYRALQSFTHLDPAGRAAVLAQTMSEIDALSPCAKEDAELSEDLALARSRLQALVALAKRAPAVDKSG